MPTQAQKPEQPSVSSSRILPSEVVYLLTQEAAQLFIDHLTLSQIQDGKAAGLLIVKLFDKNLAVGEPKVSFIYRVSPTRTGCDFDFVDLGKFLYEKALPKITLLVTDETTRLRKSKIVPADPFGQDDPFGVQGDIDSSILKLELALGYCTDIAKTGRGGKYWRTLRQTLYTELPKSLPSVENENPD